MKERDYFIPKCYIPMYDRYDRAVEENDEKTLLWFHQFGSEEWERQMIENAHDYELYLSCGYTGKPSFNSAGWLENANGYFMRDQMEIVWVFKENGARAYVQLLHHPNDTWVSAIDITLSLGGCCGYPSVWDKQYPTRREALNAALDNIIRYVASGSKAEQRLLPLVKQKRADTQQLNLFGW